MLSKENLSSDAMDTLGRSTTPYATYLDQGRCKLTSKHKFLFMISICSQQCNYSMKRLRFFCFISFAQKRGFAYEWNTTKLYDWHKIGSQLLVQWTTQNLSLSQDCHQIPAAVCLQKSRSTDQSKLFQKIGIMIRSSNDSKWQASHGEPWTSKRDEQGRANARHSCLVTALHSNLEDLEAHVLAHSSERANSDSEGEASKVGTKTEEKCSCLFPPKTIRDLFCGQNRLVKWKQQSTILSEGRESRNDHRYAVVVQVLATQWNPCQTKTSQETEKNLRKIL